MTYNHRIGSLNRSCSLAIKSSESYFSISKKQKVACKLFAGTPTKGDTQQAKIVKSFVTLDVYDKRLLSGAFYQQQFSSEISHKIATCRIPQVFFLARSKRRAVFM
jgi:hypothetical protein